MLVILFDTLVLWFLLNIFSQENWDDQKLKVFGIAIAISLLGGVAAAFSMPFVGAFPSMGVYLIIGTICLWGLASLEFKKAAAAMGIFTAYKFAVALIFLSALAR